MIAPNSASRLGVQPGSRSRPMIVKPKMKEERPRPESKKPTTSSFGTLSTWVSGISTLASTKARMPKGRFIQNTQRQPTVSVMKPPTGGPTSGPIRAGMVSQASASTSSALGTVRRRMMRPTGTIIAPPMPCKARAATRPPSELAMPQASEPRVKTAIATLNTWREPKRSASQPLTGMKTVRLSR